MHPGLVPLPLDVRIPCGVLGPRKPLQTEASFLRRLPGDGSSRGQRDKGFCPWGLLKAPASEAGRIVAVKKRGQWPPFPCCGKKVGHRPLFCIKCCLS